MSFNFNWGTETKVKQQIINIELKGEYRYKPELQYDIYQFHDTTNGRRISIFATNLEDAWQRLEDRCAIFWQNMVYDGK